MAVKAAAAPSAPRQAESALSYNGAALAAEVRTAIRNATRGSARRYRISNHESEALAAEVSLRVVSRPLSAPQRKQSGTPREVLAWIDRIERMPPASGYVATHKHEGGRMVLRPKAERLQAMASLADELMRDSRVWLDSADGWVPRDQTMTSNKRRKVSSKAPRATVALTVAEQAERYRDWDRKHAERPALVTSADALRERYTDEDGRVDHVAVSAHRYKEEHEVGEQIPAEALPEHRRELIGPMVEAAARPWWTPRNRQSAYVALSHAAGESHAAIAAELGISTRTSKRLLQDGQALILGQTDPAVLVAARREAVLRLGLYEQSDPLPEQGPEREREIATRYLIAHADRAISTAISSEQSAARAYLQGGGQLSKVDDPRPRTEQAQRAAERATWGYGPHLEQQSAMESYVPLGARARKPVSRKGKLTERTPTYRGPSIPRLWPDTMVGGNAVYGAGWYRAQRAEQLRRDRAAKQLVGTLD